MITLLTGDNSFELTRALTALKASFDGDVEAVDGERLELNQLPDLFMGGTLFSAKRMIVIRGISGNKTIWTELVEWIDRASDDIHLVLIEPSLDKRTKTTKQLLKVADVKEFKSWSDRDWGLAEKWVVEEMSRLGSSIDRKSASVLVSRVGVDQWALSQALQKLAVLDEVSPEVVREIIEANPAENVFLLFETALKGDMEGVSRMVATLSLTEDPYMLFGLLSSQAFNLVALVTSDKSSAEVASDLKVHPFALSKLTPYVKRLGLSGVRSAIHSFAEADADMKLSVAEPWLLIEKVLLEVAQASRS